MKNLYYKQYSVNNTANPASGQKHQTAQVHTVNNQAQPEKSTLYYQIGGIGLLLLLVVIYLLSRLKALKKKLAKEQKTVAYTSEKLYDALELNRSLSKRYQEIYRKFKDGD